MDGRGGAGAILRKIEDGGDVYVEIHIVLYKVQKEGADGSRTRESEKLSRYRKTKKSVMFIS